MKYALIDNDGDLHIKDGDWADIERELGTHGWDSVRLTQLSPSEGFRGHVSDCGLVLPDIYPRNPVGALVMFALGANIQPYAGPVVITGFAMPRGDDPDVTGLGDDLLDLVRMAHADVRRALEGNSEAERPHEWTPAEWQEWAAAQPELAEMVRTAESPGIRIISGRDFLGGGR